MLTQKSAPLFYLYENKTYFYRFYSFLKGDEMDDTEQNDSGTTGSSLSTEDAEVLKQINKILSDYEAFMKTQPKPKKVTEFKPASNVGVNKVLRMIEMTPNERKIIFSTLIICIIISALVYYCVARESFFQTQSEYIANAHAGPSIGFLIDNYPKYSEFTSSANSFSLLKNIFICLATMGWIFLGYQIYYILTNKKKLR